MSLVLAAELPEVGVAAGSAGLAWLLVALPAAGALVLFLAGRRADAWGHILGVFTVVAAFVVGVLIFVQTVGLAATSAPGSSRSTTGSRSRACTSTSACGSIRCLLRSYCSSRVSAA